jgi:hypothetical protein
MGISLALMLQWWFSAVISLNDIDRVGFAEQSMARHAAPDEQVDLGAGIASDDFECLAGIQLLKIPFQADYQPAAPGFSRIPTCRRSDRLLVAHRLSPASAFGLARSFRRESV